MTTAQAYAVAVDALRDARKRQREIRLACELYSPAEDADGNYPGCAESPPCPWAKRPREGWCERCAALTDIPRLGTHKAAVKAALRDVLRAGRDDRTPDGDSITRSSVELVQARDEVKRIRLAMAALHCIYEVGPIDEHGMQTDPVRRNHCYATLKSRNIWEQPCWKLVPSGGDEPAEPIGEVSDEGWCDACEAREKLREELAPARRHAGAIERGHMAATRAHMRRTGALPPLTKRERPQLSPPRLPSFGDVGLVGETPDGRLIVRVQEDSNDVPF